MKITDIPETTVPMSAAPEQAVIEACALVANEPSGSVATIPPLLFTLTLERVVARQTLSQVKQLTVGQLLLDSEALNGHVRCSKQLGNNEPTLDELGELEKIILRVNGSNFGYGTLLMLDDGWALRITCLAPTQAGAFT